MTTETETLRDRETKVIEKAISRGLALVASLHPRVPRIQEVLANTTGESEPDVTPNIILDNGILRDLAQDGQQSATSLNRAICDAERFIVHLASLSRALPDVDDWVIAAFLPGERQRSRTQPALSLRGLRWQANVAGFDWPLSSPLVHSQTSSSPARSWFYATRTGGRAATVRLSWSPVGHPGRSTPSVWR